MSKTGFGATQGGVQDLSLARAYVDRGVIPPAEAFVVEGMFSEHDLPLLGARCKSILCLGSGLGLAPLPSGSDAAFVQVGLSSNIDPASWRRPSQNLIFTVDVSGSMGWDYSAGASGGASPGELARQLMHALAERLGPNDRVSIVTYGTDTKVPLSATAANAAKVSKAIDALSSGGATNMEAGLKRAIELAARWTPCEETRIVLFTDTRPNVGATKPGDFEQMVAGAAEKGVGTTVMGLGLGLGAETFEAMSHLRSGNAYSLMKSEDVPRLMNESWPWMLTPIAFDLEVTLVSSDGLVLEHSYGFPAPKEGAGPGVPPVRASTVFLSQKRGAMLLQLRPPTAAEAGSAAQPSGQLAGQTIQGSLHYLTPSGEPMDQSFEETITGTEARDGNGAFFAQPSVAGTVALALLVDGMKQAAAGYSASPDAAASKLGEVVKAYAAAIEGLEDSSLVVELSFAKALLALMDEGAAQEDLYGQPQG